MADNKEPKREYGRRLVEMIESHRSILLVSVDNVGSKQMQEVRRALRGEATILMGKNTTIRRVLRDFLRENPNHPIAAIQDLIKGNIGFVFTNGDVGSVRDKVEEIKVPAPARVGSLAPIDVFVEPGPTGCDPGQTGWFQALNIPTKINKGQIEMISRVHLVKEGEKVSDSAAALLTKLDIKPFTYGVKAQSVFQDGEVFSAKVLDIKPEDLQAKILGAASAIASIGLELGLPNRASFVHSINNAFKAVLSIHLGTDYKFARGQEFEDFIANPANFAPAATAAAPADAGAPAEEDEEEEEEEVDLGDGGLFGDSDDDSS